jgi:hypothetical protein
MNPQQQIIQVATGYIASTAFRRRSLGFVLLGLAPAFSWAHHSVAGFFNLNKKIEIEGVVTGIQWRNPHTVFELDVADERGGIVKWRVESGALGVLRAQGLTSEVLREGDTVRILGDESLRARPEMFARNILLSNGEEVLLTLGSAPHFSRQGGVERATGRFDQETTDRARASADGIFRVWSSIDANLNIDPENRIFRDDSLDDYPYTARGKEVRAQWNAGAEFILGCTEWNMPRLMGNPLPMEFVRTGNDIVIRFEEDDSTRTIHMNAAMPSGIEPTSMGYSIGAWEGETLLVHTRHLAESTYELPVSSQAELTERFTPTPDGSRLNYEIMVFDPAMLTEPLRQTRAWLWRPEIQVQRYACEEEQRID